ncbi:MAG: M20 family metallo-hydrolase [Chloroflexi bacterium]|nr:M20 family metallo-hydrolase [Chloroflexota bacterium]
MAVARVDPQRLNGTLESLGNIGSTPEGMQRIAFSPADVDGRQFVIDLMQQAGLAVRVDTAGNVIARRAGRDGERPAIAMGSHVDTVPSGGRYDGAVGVLGAIEVVRSLNDLDVVTRHPVEVLVFTNEEGTRYHRWLFGSRAMAGLLEPADLEAVDSEGVSMAERLKAIGGDMVRVSEAGRQKGELCAYLELHIEQGPVLHRSGIPVGVVTGITGRIVFDVRVIGAANHAGTTPMDARKDALLAASRLIQAVNDIATSEGMCRVGTVGMMTVAPNAVNVVPGEVGLGAEFRDIDVKRLEDAERRLNEVSQQIAAATGAEILVKREELGQSATTSGSLQDMVVAAAQRLGLDSRPIPSGAGHDAQAMAAITDIAMVFVPSVDGLSHSPREYTTPEACADGANVLLNTLLMIDESLD